MAKHELTEKQIAALQKLGVMPSRFYKTHIPINNNNVFFNGRTNWKKQGIAISAGDYDTQVKYEFTSLNKIKPQMIEEATKNAREAAVKFANDSESKMGKIKSASQGLFSIEDRDQYTPYIKNVRVVTSVDYFLEN